jgi:hypothetical protein
MAGVLSRAALAAFVIAVVSTPVQAQSLLRVAVGQTGSTVGARSAEALSETLQAELAARTDIELATNVRAQIVVGGAVVSFERTTRGDQIEIHCEVSLIVSDARGGAIRAMLRGRGGARGSDATQLSRDALRAAVRGALRPLASQLQPRLIAER